MNRVQQMHLSKWLIVALLIIGAWTPGLILSAVIPKVNLAIYTLITFVITTFMILRSVHQEHRFVLNHTIAFRPKNRAGRRLQRLIEKSKAQFGIDAVQIRIIRKENTVHLNAASIGWPFKTRLFISETLCKRFQGSIREEVINAWLAHELSHIQARDTLINLLAMFCKTTHLVQLIGLLLCASEWMFFSNSSLLLSPFYVNPFILPLPIMISYALFFVSSLLMSQLSRIQEYLADIHTVRVTRKPQATIDFLYEKFYQYLQDGLLVTENRFAAEKRIAFHNKKDKKKLHKLYKTLKIERRDRAYEQLKNLRKNYKLSRGVEKKTAGSWQPLFGFVRYTQTWLNSHPRSDDRKRWIESAQDHAGIKYSA